MQQYSTGTRQQLPVQLFEQMGHYRREVFIQQLGWELNTVNGMELDEFDGPDAVYVCSHDEEGKVNGVARLLPTTAPYLMEKVFPQLWGGKLLPRDPRIWELSRFAAVSLKPSRTINHQAAAEHASDLLRNVMRVGALLGAHTLVTVSPIGMERLLRMNKFHVKRTGIPKLECNFHIVSLAIDCLQQMKKDEKNGEAHEG